MAWALAGILILPLILALTVPFTASATVNGDGKVIFTGRFSWIFGLLSLKADTEGGVLWLGPLALKRFVFNSTASPGKKAVQNKAKQRKTSGRRNISPSQFLEKGLVKAFMKALGSILKGSSLKVEGDARYGFDDPCITGITFGLWSASGLPDATPGLKLSPDFTDPGFKGTLSVKMRFIAGKLLFIVTRFLFSRPARRLWWPLLSRKEVKQRG